MNDHFKQVSDFIWLLTGIILEMGFSFLEAIMEYLGWVFLTPKSALLPIVQAVSASPPT